VDMDTPPGILNERDACGHPTAEGRQPRDGRVEQSAISKTLRKRYERAKEQPNKDGRKSRSGCCTRCCTKSIPGDYGRPYSP
jgi:hypothetical protein